jgi:PAS domain S-box-containing protein
MTLTQRIGALSKRCTHDRLGLWRILRPLLPAILVLRQDHDDLQQRVEQRTAELLQANLQLQQALRQYQQSEITLGQSQQSMERLSHALSHAMEGISLLDLQGHYVQINQAYAKPLGYSPEEMIGMDWQRTVHPDDLQTMQLAYQQMLRDGKVEVETRGIRRDGTIFYKQLVMVTTHDSSQNPIGHYCFMKDISDRKHKEEMLRNLSLGVATKTDKHLFQDLVEYLTKTLDVDYAIIGEVIPSDPDRVRTIAGYGDGQALENFEYAIAQTPYECVLNDQKICIYSDQIQQKFPLDPLLHNLDAESFMGVPLFASTGRVLGFITILSHQPWPETQFMTEILNIFAARAAAELERQQAEVELQQQKQDLARSNAELQQFAYVASHDLQEPLRMVTSYLELLERRYKGQLDSKADQFIDYAVDGAVRMQTLINALLSYSRIGSREPEFKPVNCADILQDVLTNLQVTIAENQALITYDPLPIVSGDRTQLTRLFQNILNNGIKFRREDIPQIHIGVKRFSDKWLFSIHDNGIGIDQQYADRIFVIFQRLHSRSAYPGTGIGLAICKKIVERHGGKLWLEPQSETNNGQGSTFHFTLPITSHF